MGSKTSISWTDSSWSPISGCTRVSEACRFCYAEGIAARFSRPGQAYDGVARMTPEGPRWTNEVRLHPERLSIPLHWKRPRRIFTASMSDLFHPGVPFEFIDKVFAVMALAPQHTFQVLTKRPERMAEYVSGDRGPYNSDETHGHRSFERQMAVVSAACAMQVDHEAVPREWPMRNVWLGTSVEDQEAAEKRIPHLLNTPAIMRFLSAEPLLGPLDLSRWIGCYPHDEADERKRGNIISGDSSRVVEGSEGRLGLARGTSVQESMGWEGLGDAMQTAPNRRGGRGWVQDRESNGEWQADNNVRPSFSLALPEGANTAWHDHQPPQWEKGRQPPEESGGRYLLREYAPCISDRSYFGMGREKPSGKAFGPRCPSNSRKVLERGNDASETCTSPWSLDSDNFENRSREQQDPPAGTDSGLYASEKAQEYLATAQRAIREPRIHLVIMGGESGSKARPCDLEWLRGLVRQCRVAGVAPFVKQLGTRYAREHKLRDYKGSDVREFPEELRVQEFPEALQVVVA